MHINNVVFVQHGGCKVLPLLKERAAGIFNILQLQKTGTDQERLDILLVYGYVSVIRKIDQSFKSTLKGNEKKKKKTQITVLSAI